MEKNLRFIKRLQISNVVLLVSIMVSTYLMVKRNFNTFIGGGLSALIIVLAISNVIDCFIYLMKRTKLS